MSETIDLTDFKEIPHFSNYMASKEGVIYCKNGFFPSVSTFPTSKGKYLTCSVVRDSDKVRQDIVIHRLIALTYHYPGENWIELDVNHKDGDKENNNEDNLEWCTKGENLKHAYTIGLRKDHRQYLLYDGENSVVVCKSIQDIALLTKYPLGVILGYIPIQGNLSRKLGNRWRIELDTTHTPIINRTKQASDIICFNCKDKTEIRVSTSFEASLVVGVSFATVLYNTNALHGKRKPSMINGWWVWYVDRPYTLPEYSDEDVEKSTTKAKRLAEQSLNRYEQKLKTA